MAGPARKYPAWKGSVRKGPAQNGPAWKGPAQEFLYGGSCPWGAFQVDLPQCLLFLTGQVESVDS